MSEDNVAMATCKWLTPFRKCLFIAMNKISYFLTYHSFLFYISKLLDATVIFYSLLFIFYFLYSFSFSPRGRFVFQTEISGKYIVLVLISRLFYFLSSLRRGDQSTVFCIVSFDFNWSRSPKIRHGCKICNALYRKDDGGCTFTTIPYELYTTLKYKKSHIFAIFTPMLRTLCMLL